MEPELTDQNRMKPIEKSVINVEILSFLKSYCGEKLVSEFVNNQKRMQAVEHRVLHQGDRSPRAGSKFEISLEDEAVYDQLVTLCKRSLSEYEYPEAMLGIGDLFKSHGELQKAEQTYSNVMQYGAKTGHEEFVAEALLRRGEVYCRRGLWKETDRDLDMSQRLFLKAKDRTALARVENLRGTCCAEQGHLEKARLHYSKALWEFQQSEEKVMAGTVLMNLGIVHNIMGDWQKAIEFYHSALPYFQSAGDPRRISEVHHNLGMSQISRCDYSEALHEFEKGLSLSTKLHDPRLVGLTQLGKAVTFFKIQDLSCALAFCSLALKQFEKTNDRLSVADSYKIKGMILREMKQYDLAETHFQTSLRINDERGNQLNLGETYYELGILKQKQRQGAEAKSAFEQAFRLFERVSARSKFAETKRELESLKGRKK
jgi:tetratricopeptide (TPR) repeat protein